MALHLCCPHGVRSIPAVLLEVRADHVAIQDRPGLLIDEVNLNRQCMDALGAPAGDTALCGTLPGTDVHGAWTAMNGLLPGLSLTAGGPGQVQLCFMAKSAFRHSAHLMYSVVLVHPAPLSMMLQSSAHDKVFINTGPPGLLVC